MSSSWRVPTAEERELIVDWKRRIDGRLRPILLLCMVPEIVMPVVIFILFIVSGKDPGKVLWIFALLLLFLPFTLALWFVNSRGTRRVRRGDFRVKDANVMDVFRNKDGELTVKAEISSGEVMEIPVSGTIWKALRPGAAGYYLSFDKEVFDENNEPETMSAHTSSDLKMYMRSRITDSFYPAFREESLPTTPSTREEAGKMGGSWRTPTAEECEAMLSWKRKIDKDQRKAMIVSWSILALLPVSTIAMGVTGNIEPGEALRLLALMSPLALILLIVLFFDRRKEKRIENGDVRVLDAAVVNTFRNVSEKNSVSVDTATGEIMEIEVPETVNKVVSLGTPGLVLRFDRNVIDENEVAEDANPHSNVVKFSAQRRWTRYNFYPAFRAEE